MGLTLAQIKQAVTDLSLSETITFAYGTESEANLIADYITAGGIFIWIAPIVNNYERSSRFENKYTVTMLWGQATDLDSIHEDSATIFETLEGYCKRHVNKLSDNLRATGAIRGIAVESGSIIMDRFNRFDANIDGVFHTFDVVTSESISC